MRLFFALDIDPATQHAIGVWRDRTIPPTGRAVPAANFHITLNFLGELTSQQLQRLRAEADKISADRFELLLDETGYFPASGAFWIAPGDPPAELTDLVDKLRKASRKAGIKTSRKPFQPHITLFRNYRARPTLSLPSPRFEISCDGFALFQSVTGHKGVRYRAVRHWPAK